MLTALGGLLRMSNLKYCTKCGIKIIKDGKYCCNCGKLIIFNNSNQQEKIIETEVQNTAAIIKRLISVFVILLLVITFLFFAFIGGKKVLADKYYKKAEQENDYYKKIDFLEKAVNYYKKDDYYIGAANAYAFLAKDVGMNGRNQSVFEDYINHATEYGRQAIAISPDKPSVYEAVALIYENVYLDFNVNGALEQAEKYYNKSIELNSKNPYPHLRIGHINMARADAETNEERKKYFIEEAINKYNEAILLNSNMDEAVYDKGIALEKLDRIDDAIEQLKQAILIARDNLNYRFDLGRLYFNRGVAQASLLGKNDDVAMAEQIFLSILQINPNHENTLYSLALLYQKIGETDNAKIVINQLLKQLENESTEETSRSKAVKEIIKKQFPELY